MVINTNTAAQESAGFLAQSSQLLAKSLGRLASGFKIVSPEDDAAGLAVSMRFDAQINRTRAASQNLGNALSFTQTQDGFLKKIGKALDRMSELSVMAQDITKTDGDRSLYNREFQTLNSYINDVVTKDFNGVSLFGTTSRNVTSDGDGGTFQIRAIQGNYLTPPSGPPSTTALSDLVPGFTSGRVTFGNVGDNLGERTFSASETLGDFQTWLNDVLNGNNLDSAIAGSASYAETSGELSVTLDNGFGLFEGGDSNLLSGLGLGEMDNRFTSNPVTNSVTLASPTPTPGAPDISTVSGAASALTSVKSAINQLTSDRATVGATITRLNYTTEQLGVLNTNLSSANSRIKDVNVAEESSEYARYNILVQSGTAMLAQANTMPNSTLRLLG
jgi:flagellin